MEQPQVACQGSETLPKRTEKEQDSIKISTLSPMSSEKLDEAKKGKKQGDNADFEPLETNFKLKFNTSQENLRCFISECKPQRYRSVSTRLPKPSKSAACLPSTKFHIKSSIEQKVAENTKSQTERQSDLRVLYQQDGQDSDLSRILSNQIIHHIQQKGIYCKWNDIEEKRSQDLLSQDEQYFDTLLDSFSDKKSARRSLQGDSSLYKEKNISANNSLVENRDSFTVESDEQQYSSYGNSSYGQGYENIYDKNFSYASTMEPYQNAYYPMQMYPMSHGQSHGLRSMPSSMFQSNEFIITPEGLGKDPRTTLMIKNIPNKYTIQYLSEQIDQDFGNYYDFLYLPCDTKSGANQGYGFINFIDLDAIKRFYERFHNKKWKRFRSQKICNLTYARLQGIESLIEHFQNSKVLNHKQKKYQPIIKSLSQIHHLIKTQQNNQQQQIHY